MTSENERLILDKIDSVDRRVETLERKVDKRLRPLEKIVYGALGAIGALSVVAVVYQAFFK